MINDENAPDLELDENKNQDQGDDSNDNSNDDSHDDSEQQPEVDYKAKYLAAKAILDRNKNKKTEVARIVSKEVETPNLNTKDMYALSQAQVHIDDIDDVVDYAKFKKISVQEALKTDVIKTTLANKSEYRKTADATNTGAARRGAIKVSDDTLQSNLSKGTVPEKGSEEAERLFWARRGGKR